MTKLTYFFKKYNNIVKMNGQVDLSIIGGEDRINLTSDLCKKLADLVRDPTRGVSMEGELRNKLREEYHADLLTCLDTLTLLAHSEASFLDTLTILKKLQTGITKSV